MRTNNFEPYFCILHGTCCFPDPCPKCSVYVRYHYPFFGSSKPIYSGAPVPLSQKNQEIKLPEPFCQFDFSCLAPDLENQCRSTPLILEVFTRSDDCADTCVGAAILPMEKLVPVSSKPKMLNEALAVFSQGGNKLIGQIKVKFWLENKGPIKQQVILPPQPEQLQKQQFERQQQQQQIKEHQNMIGAQKKEMQEMQFKTALDLELWKSEQEEQFIKQLKIKEKDLLSR